MKTQSVFLVLCAPFVFLVNLRTCSSIPEYGMANHAGTANYAPRPFYSDTSTTALYGAVYGQKIAKGFGWQEKDDALLFGGGLSLARSSRRWSTTAGVSGYTGYYSVQGTTSRRGEYSLGGMILQGEEAFCVNSRNSNWRVAGFYLGLNREWGEYPAFRHVADRDSLLIDVHPQNQLLNAALTTEYLHCRRNQIAGIKGWYGIFAGQPVFGTNVVIGTRRWTATLGYSCHPGSYSNGQWVSGIAFRIGS